MGIVTLQIMLWICILIQSLKHPVFFVGFIVKPLQVCVTEKGGIDSTGLAQFFERTKRKEVKSGNYDDGQSSRFEEYFLTHPQTEKRIDRLQSNNNPVTGGCHCS